MKMLLKSITLVGALGALHALTSCDGADPEKDLFSFSTARFNAASLANLGATANMPLYIQSGDQFVFTPNGPTTSHDEDYTPVMSRHGATLPVNGLNIVTFERYQDPALQARFPAVQATWLAGEGSTQATLTSADSIDQSEIDIFTQFAFDNADGGGVFTNPFTDSNGPLDGNVTTALAQAGLPDVSVSEAKGDLIETELKALGKEIYNNADTDEHMHGGPPAYQEPVLRATVRRVFTFTANSTNNDIVTNNQISGTYQIFEQYQHLYTHDQLGSATGYIRMRIQNGQFAGNEMIEEGTFILNLSN